MAIAAEALLRLKTVFDGSGIDRASRAIGELQRQAGSSKTPLGRVSQGLDRVNTAAQRLATGGAVAAGAGLTYSAVKAVQFEDSLSDIKKALQLKVNSPQFKKLGDEFLRLSRNVPVAANELSELGGMAALAGKDSSAEILKFAGNTAKLGVAFRMPGREAAESFLAIQAQLGLTDEKTMDLMGTVNKLSDTFPGKVEARDILKGFQAGLGGVGKMAGMTGEQTAGFYSAFLAAGTPSDAAATAMKNFLNSLTGGSSLSNEKKAALGQLFGMPVDPVRKQLNDELAQINKQITSGLDGVGQQRSEAIENLIDEARFQGRKFIEFEGQTLSLSQAGIIKKKLNEETSAYTKGLKERANEIKAQLKKMPSGGDLVAIDLAKRIQADPEGTITDILQRIKQLPKDQQAGIVNEIFGKESQLGISAILSNIGLVKQGFDVAGKATENASSWLTEYNSQLENSSSQFKLLRNAFDEMAIRIGQALLPVLTQAMRDLTPTIIELIPAVVELAKSGLPLLVQGLKAVLPYVQRFAAWAKENPQALRDLIGTIGKVTAAFIALGVAAGVLRSIATVIGVLRTVGGVLKTAFAGKGAATAAAGGAGFFTPLINAAKGLGAKVLGPVRSLISALKIAFADLTLKEVFPGLAEKLQKLRQMFGGKAAKPAFDISQAANNIRRTQPVNAIKPFARIPPPMPPMPWLARMGQAVMSLLPVLATVGRAVLAFFSGPVGWITLLATAAIAAYAFRDKLIPAFAGIGAIWNTYVVTPIRTGWTALVAWFGTTMSGVGSGLSVAWQTVSTFFNTYVITPIKAMWDGFVFYVLQTIQAFAIVWWRGVAAGFQTYVVQPIQFAWGALMTALSTLWTGFTTWLGSSIGTIRTVLSGIWTGIATTFQTYVLTPIQQGWGAFTQWFYQSTAGVRQWLMDLWQGVSQGFYTNVVQPIQEGWNGLTQWLSTTVGSVRGWFGSMWDGLAQGFSTQIATPIQNIWRGVLEFVQAGWRNTTTWFYGMFSGIGQAFNNNLVQPIRNAFSGLVSGLQGLISGLFGWLRNVGNTAIGFVNRVRGAAGMQPIQGFARGGHVSGPTLAWVGEGGDPGGEYIIPAKKMAGASMAYLSGARGASVIPRFASGGFIGGGGGRMNYAFERAERKRLEKSNFDQLIAFSGDNPANASSGFNTLRKLQTSTQAGAKIIDWRDIVDDTLVKDYLKQYGPYKGSKKNAGKVFKSLATATTARRSGAATGAFERAVSSTNSPISKAQQWQRVYNEIVSSRTWGGFMNESGWFTGGRSNIVSNMAAKIQMRMLNDAHKAIFGVSLYSGGSEGRIGNFAGMARGFRRPDRSFVSDFEADAMRNVRRQNQLDRFSRFAKGGYVNRPTLGWIGEGGESEYIIPSSRMAQSAMAYLNGARGAAVLNAPGFATGGYVGGADRSGNPLQALMDRVGTIDSLTLNEPPQINDGPIQVTTGPVLEFDGQRYVTMDDYQRGLRDVKRQTLGEIRTAAGRKATGR